MKQANLKVIGSRVFYTLSYMIRLMAYMIESHKFFARKSQHYVLGNWVEFVKDKKEVRKYRRRYIRSWVNFMRLCFSDFVNRRQLRDKHYPFG